MAEVEVEGAEPVLFIQKAIVIGNGFVDAENQGIGLVRGVGLSTRYSIHRVTRPAGGIYNWLRWLPLSFHRTLVNFMRLFQIPGEAGAPGILEADASQIARTARERFQEEGPLLVVASGPETVSVASSIKRLAPDSVFVVQIQPPRVDLKKSDFVIINHYDYDHSLFLRWWTKPPGENVFLTEGVLHQADHKNRIEAVDLLGDELSGLRGPLLIVYFGRPTKNCPYGKDLAKQFGPMLRSVLNRCQTAVIYFSGTPRKISEVLTAEFRDNPKVSICNGQEPDPHMAYLAIGDAFVVTADLMSTLCEACSMGKPVYVVGAERCTSRLAYFQNRLNELGAARPFTGDENIDDQGNYPALTDTDHAGAKLITALGKRGWNIML